MGKTRCLMEVLANGCDENLRRRFVQDFAHWGNSEFQAQLRLLTTNLPQAGGEAVPELIEDPQAA
jgi:hypothetical protein